MMKRDRPPSNSTHPLAQHLIFRSLKWFLGSSQKPGTTVSRRNARNNTRKIYHSGTHRFQIPFSSRWLRFFLVLSLGFSLTLLGTTVASVAQTRSPAATSTPKVSPAPSPKASPKVSPAASSEASPEASPQPTTAADENKTVTLSTPKPVVAPGQGGQYVLEFNRSPVVGNRFRFDGIYDEARLSFTRPRHWQIKTVKVHLRYRHSPALYATRSNMTVIINGASIGSLPLNQPENKIGDAVFEVPLNVLQNYNELVVAVLQNNSPTCTQDPYDPSLWSEVLPDSKIVFDFQPQPVSLDFSQYPYPIFDELSLESNQVAYLQPKTIDEDWLTATTRFHAALGRVADFRTLENRTIQKIEDVKETERLIIIGTPKTQPILQDLKLPLKLQGDRLTNPKGEAIAPDTGILILTTAQQDKVPVLIATGNGPEGVAKAVQFLVQPQNRQMGTGPVILVESVMPVETPPLREWKGYLPLQNSFQLKDLKNYQNQPYQDVTVRGSHSPAMDFDFKVLPDERLLPGNEMVLRYSYGPQINPLTSMIEVALDGVALDGARLTSVAGAKNETLVVRLPEERITPQSRIQVNFRLDPRERRSCSRVTDQQLWGTIHADTQFELQREPLVKLPDLKLLKTGYPFVAPQDLSNTAIALANQPSTADLNLLLEVAERLGRLSKADSVQVSVYRISKLPPSLREQAHLIGIGSRQKFPFPEVFENDQRFQLQPQTTRNWQESQIQTPQDSEGVVQQRLSPWNGDRALLALSAQNDTGLQQLRDLFGEDPLFYQLQGDTVLISRNTPNPSAYDPNDYSLEFLQQTTPRTVKIASAPEQFWQQIRRSWFMLASGMVVAALVLYGVLQMLMNRAGPEHLEGGDNE